MSEYSNLRRDPFTAAYSYRAMDTEYHTIAEFDELPGRYGFQLQDKPESGSVTIIEDITGGEEFVQVTTAPLEGQCRIDYVAGYVFFNVADNGKDCVCDYNGGGTNMSVVNIEETIDSKISSFLSDFILDYIYKVDDVFVQWPIAGSNTIATAFPASQRPAAKFGGTWSQIWETDAVFFRTEGDFHASDAQNTNRTDGKQTHQSQYHWHIIFGDSGAGAGVNLQAQANTNLSYDHSFGSRARTMDDDGTHGSILAGYENRPQNRIFLLWKRTA